MLLLPRINVIGGRLRQNTFEHPNVLIINPLILLHQLGQPQRLLHFAHISIGVPVADQTPFILHLPLPVVLVVIIVVLLSDSLPNDLILLILDNFLVLNNPLVILKILSLTFPLRFNSDFHQIIYIVFLI